jgi:hypothetical protein
VAECCNDALGTHGPWLPISLKLGDVNLDGFPGALVIVAPQGSQTQDPKPHFFFGSFPEERRWLWQRHVEGVGGR